MSEKLSSKGIMLRVIHVRPAYTHGEPVGFAVMDGVEPIGEIRDEPAANLVNAAILTMFHLFENWETLPVPFRAKTLAALDQHGLKPEDVFEPRWDEVGS